ncbi:ATP-binding cassette domain-containing protein [Rhizobium sp. SEMIA 4085]|uniref:ABC transporter transmembrane domain-containing protein n=1 Tax=Rhizobium TaxID=379 RepID=UPI0009E5941C|nr:MULTISPECIES: ABC transporter transmembrane domain-containing protein [Rhizobium]NNH28476.1 ATP-binding cassette domain-containing protein [Rhizobium sp. SEMIA 4085]
MKAARITRAYKPLISGIGAIGDDLANAVQTAEKKSRSLKPFGRLAPYVKRYRGIVAGALVSLVVAAVTSLTLPLAVRRMIDHGFTQADGTFINSYFAMLLVIAVILAAASAFRYYFVITLGERIVSDLRRDVFAHVTRLSPSFFDVNQSGEIVSRLTADTTQIKSAVGATASVALRNLILCLGAMGMMIVTSPKLSSLVLGAIPLIVFPLVGFGRSVRKRSRAAQDTLAEASAFANETIAATRTVQAFNGEDAAASRYGAAVESAYEAARSAIRSRALLTGIAITLIFGSVVAVLWVGAHNVLTGTLSAGTLGQFLLYSVIAAGSLGALSEVWGELSQAAGAADRLTELLDEVSTIAAPEKPETLPVPALGRVELSNVHFAYPSRPGKSALHGLSFNVTPGETVAIVGPSGAGKSTVFSVLLRFYDPQQGSVGIDGIDAREVTPGDLRERMAIVPQDVTIFAASIHDNIAFSRPGATREDVRTAAIAAQADEFIARLDKGYDTEVGERGITLSGGQRQRIAIARAILKNAPILLLDEATSALDAESETLVQKALDGLMHGRTTLVIAHRLATVLKADRILVMDQGRIVEEGTHQSLIRHGGIYARLAKLQFDAGAEEVLATAK